MHLLGVVDVATPDRVMGWARDSEDPSGRLTVWVEVNGITVGSGIADMYRPDLAGPGQGDGNYAFDIRLPGAGPRVGDALRCLASRAPVALRLGPNAKVAATAAPATEAAAPVFVIGAVRSGTTILASSLEKAGYFGFGEGHLLSLLPLITACVNNHFDQHDIRIPNLLLSQVDRTDVLDAFLDALKQLQERYNSGKSWFDKTPGTAMVVSAQTLLKLWPTASFVYAKRRGIENIASRMKKFPERDFDYHCRSWAETMAAWRRARGPSLRAVEIDQFDIAHHPEATASRLGAFLRVGDAATQRVFDEMTGARPQQSDESSSERVLSLKTCGWTVEQIGRFRELCTEEMEAYGYRLDEKYRDGPEPA
jgi:hypothetical protein